MPIEIPPGDDALRAHVVKLTMEVTLTRTEVRSMRETYDAKFAGLMTPQQITLMNQQISDETIKRVEELLNGVTSRFGEIEFSAARLDSIDKKLADRATAAAESDRKQDAVIGWINIMAARDVTDPDSKAIAEPYFDVTKRLATEANALSLATAREINEWRTDHALAMQTINTGIETVKEIAAELKPLAQSAAQNAQRWKLVQDALKNVLSNPRLLLPTVAALGGGAVLTPEVIKAVNQLIVGVFKILSGAN